MTAIAVTAAQIGLVKSGKGKADIQSYIATETITKGQAVYILTTGKVGVADANAGGKFQFRGIALNGASAGEAVDVLHDGLLYGFGVSGLSADAKVYLSDTAGGLDTAAGSATVVAGRVVSLTDSPTLTKVLRIFTRWSEDWS